MSKPQFPRALLAVVVLVVTAPFLARSTILSYLRGAGLATLSTAPAVGQNSELQWYPPSSNRINNLTVALGSKGTDGFIYNTSHTPDDKYGIYNWCNMPHVRKREYEKAPDEYELVYVELIQRHHKRTPYASNAFPVEPYNWNCDDQGLYYFGKPFTEQGKQPTQGYWKGFASETNPFVPSGWVGSCQFPQVTAAGLDDSWVHGNDLYGVYHELLQFLPGRDEDWRTRVKFRVTNNQITSQVAGMFINGMWDTTESVPLLIQQASVDSLEPKYNCIVGNTLFSAIKSASNSNWESHLTRSRGLFKMLDDISGVPTDDEGFHESFDHYFDNLSARQCHSKPLPCKLIDGSNSSTCVDQETTNTVYRLGQWEYSQIFRDAPSSLAASSTTYGVWIAELTSHIRAVMAGDESTIYLHNFAHDGSMSRLLGILQIDVMVWPGMGSEVVFELYRKGEYYVRVLFGGKVLKSSNPNLGVMEMVPVETLLTYFDGLTGENGGLIRGRCSGLIPV